MKRLTQFRLTLLIVLIPVAAGLRAQTGEGASAYSSRVATLLDANTTSEMHDDTTILRNVRVLEDETGLVIGDALRVWVGGALQYDYYNFDGIYNYSSGGDRREGGSVRRLEGIFRSSLYDWGEIKAQYDFDDGVMRDLYLRWVSKQPNTPVTVTLGNQSEPMGLDLTMGNKFSMAQESSAPSHAFGDWRSLGLRLHSAFQLERSDRPLDIFDDEAAFLTTSVGVFTSDIEDSHDTDAAVTARVTGGRQRDGIGIHVGVSASYRDGVYDRIRFRPEVQEADRITLASPRANTLGIVGLEGAYNRGPLHLQAEAWYAGYHGRINGYGGGAYLQGGWFITGQSRDYNPRWGVLAPPPSNGKLSAEVFARVSHIRGDDEVNGWNDYLSATIGTNLFYRRLRGSINLLYGESREPIGAEGDGFAVNIRAQHLF